MRKWRLIQLRISILALLVSTHCSLASVSLAEQSQRMLRVAVIVPLSGPVAPYGEAVRRGIELRNQKAVSANRSTNAMPLPDKTVQFEFYDNEFHASRSLSTAQSLTRKSSPPDVIISIDATHAHTLSPFTEEHEIVLLSASSDPAAFHTKQFAVRTWSDGREEGAALANKSKEAGLRSIATVFSPSDYHNILAESFAAALPEAVHQRRFEIAPYDSSVLASVAARLQRERFEGVLLLLHPGMVSDFMRRSKELQYSPLFLSGIQLELDAERVADSSAVSTYFVTRQVSDTYRCYHRALYKDESLLSLSAIHYDIAQMLTQYAQASETWSSTSLLSFIENYTNANGASGEVAFEKSDQHLSIMPALELRSFHTARTPCPID